MTRLAFLGLGLALAIAPVAFAATETAQKPASTTTKRLHTVGAPATPAPEPPAATQTPPKAAATKPTPPKPVATKPAAAKPTAAKPTAAKPTAAQAAPKAAPVTDPAAAAARARAAAPPRRLEDIHIEGEVPVPQVLFVTARDQRRLAKFQHQRYLKSSRELGESTMHPSRIAVTRVPPPPPSQEGSR
jgi:hypothetical protein